jgi:hypothetical protein
MLTTPPPSIEQLSERLARLERRHARLKVAFVATLVLGLGCGAASTTAQYRKVTSHVVAIFGANEDGEVLTLERAANGGRLTVRDSAGRVRVEIDADGLRTRDAGGAERWSSTPPP